jgi:hypothetical protein
MTVGAIKVHEFIARDGVFEDPPWTFGFGFGFGFDPRMGAATGAVTNWCRAIGSARR